jgi:hypothetical protein
MKIPTTAAQLLFLSPFPPYPPGAFVILSEAKDLKRVYSRQKVVISN